MASVDAILVDTNVFIYLMRGASDKASEYAPFVNGKRIVLSFVTVAELWRGAITQNYGDAKRKRLAADIDVAIVVPPDEALSRMWGELTARARTLGHALGQKAQNHDAWIAATAELYELPLLTEDSDFSGFPSLTLLP
ncbi:MAG TPA: PIN domain-containing protein [Solirubrobacterales bacterium]|nr:PIN domain-containing protein [Solirubrobacterales bacterium]